MKKAKIFTKYPEPKEGESPDDIVSLIGKQSRDLQRYCDSKNLYFNNSCLGVSQASYNLPFMDQMKPILEWFEKNQEHKVLLVYSEDELSKDKKEIAEFKKELSKRGVKLIILHKSKGFSLEHEELMKKALPEIVIIYKSLKSIKKSKYQETALDRFNNSPQEFSFIKHEYLERDPLYKNLKGKQKARTFFGKILQYIFQDNGLPKVNKEKIIEEIRKTDTWKEFRGY
jgi:hypothetical protein